MASARRLLLLPVLSTVHAISVGQNEEQGVCLLQGMARKWISKGNSANLSIMEAKSLARATIDFEPHHWNDNPAVLRSHNCYEYALNDVDSDAAQHCKTMLQSNKVNQKQCRRWFHIPGYRYHQHDLHEVVRFNKSTVSCQHLMERVASDGKDTLLWAGPNNEPTTKLTGKSWKHEDQCPDGSYMASLVVLPGHRFHFYRRDHMCQNQENKGKLCWSHKPGILNATRFDSKGREIYDLHKADRSYGKHSYTDVCGFFCVPGNEVHSTHSEFYRGGKKHRWAVV